MSSSIIALPRNRFILFTAFCLFFVWNMGLCHAADNPVGEIVLLEGDATVRHSGETTAAPIRIGAKIFIKDVIKTEPGTKLRIQFVDSSIVSVGENTRLTVTNYLFSPERKVRSSMLDVAFGKVKVFANNLFGFRDKAFKVKTPTAIIGVRGTVFLVWVVDSEVTKVASFENDITVANFYRPQDFLIVTQNNWTEVKANLPPDKPVLVTPELFKELQQGLL
ncbi:MAG: FecR domain-containing protein, partial [Deltaproteobacteria bacterium]|nr:FecR domain-containing protein [Deltaproteobacteria bacterium]